MPIINYPGPYRLSIKYTTPSAGQHVCNFNLDCVTEPAVGANFADVDLVTKDASALDLDTFTSDMIDRLKGFFHSAVTFDESVLLKYAPLTTISTFVTSRTETAVGSNAVVHRPAGYGIYTFRTGEGGRYRTNLYEISIDEDFQRGYAALAAYEKTLVDFIKAVDSPILGRDTSFVYSFGRASYGTDERLFNKIFR